MQLSPDHGDIDRAIAELNLGIGREIKAIQAARKAALIAEIEQLKARIDKRRSQHKRTEELSREYCELTAKRIQFELCAA